jgi:hypothetical protein
MHVFAGHVSSPKGFVHRAERFSAAASAWATGRRRAEALGYRYEGRHPEGTRRPACKTGHHTRRFTLRDPGRTIAIPGTIPHPGDRAQPGSARRPATGAASGRRSQPAAAPAPTALRPARVVIQPAARRHYRRACAAALLKMLVYIVGSLRFNAIVGAKHLLLLIKRTSGY